MKKILWGLSISLLAVQVQAGTVPTCRCAGQCSSGTICNCATNSCTARRASPYAYGYVDTRSPVYVAPTYVAPAATAYPSAYNTGSSPVRKTYRANVAPYFAGRFMLSKAMADFEHNQTIGPLSAKYKGDLDDTVLGGAIAFGVRVDNLRFEVEGAMHSDAETTYPHAHMVGSVDQDKMKHKVQAMSVLLNAYYDVPLSSVLKPYVGGGIGMGRLKSKLTVDDPVPGTCLVDVDSHSSNKTNFIWQLGAGLSYALNKRVDLDVGYRYTHYGKMAVLDWYGTSGDAPATEELKLKDYHTHTLSVGLRVDI